MFSRREAKRKGSGLMIHRDIPEEPIKLTHKQAVRRISNWMRGTMRYTAVFTELTTRARETPDVIGWRGSNSTLIEVKVTRSDFLADKKKFFRRLEHFGVGDKRYYACPSGLIKVEELPKGWGLLEIREHQIREMAEPETKVVDKREEVTMLLSAIRRLEISTAVFVMQEDPDE